MNYQSLLDSIATEVAPMIGQGKVADYIPALARVPIAQFGIALRTIDGHTAAAGDADTPFSIQSVSKVLGLTLGLQAMGPTLWERIGREPSGNAFNSLVQLESERGKPRKELGHLEGRSTKMDVTFSYSPTDNRGQAEWVVRAADGTKVSLEARSDRAGTIRKEIVLA